MTKAEIRATRDHVVIIKDGSYWRFPREHGYLGPSFSRNFSKIVDLDLGIRTRHTQEQPKD